MTDRRRANAPIDGTSAPIYAEFDVDERALRTPKKPRRERAPDALRAIFLKTALTPPATGSAFLELPANSSNPTTHSGNQTSTLKLTCSVYGPRPLPPSSTFSPTARLSCEVKFSPFSSHKRRGYVRDHTERDLSTQLTTALNRSILLEKYPKAGIDVFVTVLDCEGEAGEIQGINANVPSVAATLANLKQYGDSGIAVEIGQLGVLSGAITCASAALADAGIECLDLVSGGVAAALVTKRPSNASLSNIVTYKMEIDDHNDSYSSTLQTQIVLDPSPEEHSSSDIIAACCVGYMAARDELTLTWMKGSILACLDSDGEEQGEAKGDEGEEQQCQLDRLVNGAIVAATETRKVLNEAVRERLLVMMAVAREKK